MDIGHTSQFFAINGRKMVSPLNVTVQFDSLADENSGMMQGVATGIKDNVPLVTDELDALGATINEDYGAFMEEFKSTLTSDLDELRSDYEEAMDDLSSATSRAMDDMEYAVSSATRSISRDLRDLMDDIDDTIDKLRELSRAQSRYGGRGGSDRDDDGESRSYRSGESEPVYAFASGGVVREPTYALVGEYQSAHSNPEIIAPQSRIEESVVAANGQLVQMMVQAFNQG